MANPALHLHREIRTERLLLRAWRASDREPFAALNANPHVMEYLPSVLSREQSDSFVARIEAQFERQGFGLWAVEVPGVAEFAGFLGLGAPSFDAHITPCVELGWRLDEQYWGFGFATEGARGAVKFAFDSLHLQQIVAFTVPENARSRRVMEKLEMTHAPEDDFDHPRFPEGHRLRRHVLYRLSSEAPSNKALQLRSASVAPSGAPSSTRS